MRFFTHPIEQAYTRRDDIAKATILFTKSCLLAYEYPLDGAYNTPKISSTFNQVKPHWHLAENTEMPS